MKPVSDILAAIRAQGYGRAFPGRGSEGSPLRRDPFHVLITTVLSQRTKDANTRAASERLFERYDSPGQIAGASSGELAELIRPAGFPNAKSKAIKDISRIIMEDFDGRVPDDMESLLSLPQVGRKTANCVLAYAFHKDAICVDTHVHRICNRIGIVQTGHPDATEAELRRVVPRSLWRDINSLMVVFGQQVCRPRHPRCDICPVSSYCDYYVRKFLPGTR